MPGSCQCFKKKIWILMPTLQSSMHVPSSRSCNLPISLSHGTFLHLHIQEQASKIPSLQSQSHKQRISKHHTWETRRTNHSPSQEACPLGEEMDRHQRRQYKLHHFTNYRQGPLNRAYSHWEEFWLLRSHWDTLAQLSLVGCSGYRSAGGALVHKSQGTVLIC